MPRILIVEDMQDSLDAFAMALRMGGHSVLAATDQQLAIASYVEQSNAGTPFDLVILDLAMPGMNGVLVAERIREFDEGARIAFLTAFDDPLSVGRAEVTGAVAFWSKPITAPDLCAKVAQVLEIPGHQPLHV